MFEEYPDYQQEMLNSAYAVIERLEKWEFLKSFEPGDGGFMFSDNPTVNNIAREIDNDYGGHSGGSLLFTMRIMQKISKTK